MTNKVNKKTISRLCIVQVIYQLYFFNYKRDILEILEDTLDYYNEYISKEEFDLDYKIKVNKNFILNIINVFTKNREEIELKLKSLLEKCSYEPDLIAQCIIKSGISEIMLNNTNTPKKVIISEFTNIAASLINDSKIAVVNSCLDKVANT